MSIFGQVWVFSAIAFVLGAFLAWLFLVRPARGRIRELERRLAASESSAPSSQASRVATREPEFAGTRVAPAVSHAGFDDPDPVAAPSQQGFPGTRQFEAAPAVPAAELTQQLSPATDWPERDSLASARADSRFTQHEQAEEYGRHEDVEEPQRTDLFGSPVPPRHGLGEPDDVAEFEPAGGARADADESAELGAATEWSEFTGFSSTLDGPADSAAPELAEATGGVEDPADGIDSIDGVDGQETVRTADAPVMGEPAEPVAPAEPAASHEPLQRPGSLFQPMAYEPEPEPEPEPEQPELPEAGGRHQSVADDAEPVDDSVDGESLEQSADSSEDAPPAYAFGEPGAKPDEESAVEQTQILPKRQPRQSPAGGFDPPQPIQPSMRPVARREPEQDAATHSGSLFEPSVAPGPGATPPAAPDDDGVAEVVAEAAASDGGEPSNVPPAREDSYDRSALPPGPFGPGSAMPKPGGGSPSEDFTVKASVTALRYCTDESPQYVRMVAEVWFRTPADAERVGFRPLS